MRRYTSWARYVSIGNEGKFAKLGKNVFYLSGEDSIVSADTIECFEKFFMDIKMPISLTELGLNLDDDDLKMIAKKITNNDGRMIGTIKKLNSDDVYEILKMAK